VGRRRFLVAEALEERTLLSDLFANLTSPEGVTTDLSGNVYISYNDYNVSSGQQQAVAEYTSGGALLNSAVMLTNGPNAYPGSLVSLGSSESLPTLNTGDILEMQPDGETFTYRPSTGGSSSYSQYQGNTFDASSVYDPQTGSYLNLNGTISLSSATFGGFGIDGSNILVSGDANGWDFVMRASYSQNNLGTISRTDKILLAAPLDGDSPSPRGLAVNPQGTVLTTLPSSTGLETLVAFNVQRGSLSPVIPNLGLPEPPTITAGGITLDSLGDFVLATGATSLLEGAPGYVAITPDLSQYSANESTSIFQNGAAPQPWLTGRGFHHRRARDAARMTRDQ